MAQFGPGSRANGLPSFLLEGIEIPAQKENVRQARRKEVDVTAYSKLRFADFVDQMMNHGKGTYEHKATGTVWFKEGDMLMRTDDEDVLMVRSHMLEIAKKKKPGPPSPTSRHKGFKDAPDSVKEPKEPKGPKAPFVKINSIFRDKKNKKGMFVAASDGDVRVACQQVIDAWAECPFSTLVEIVKYGVDNDYDCDAVCEAVHDIADVRVPDSAIDKLCGVLKNKDADEVIEQYDGQDFADIMCELTGKEKKAALNDDYFGYEGDDETVEIGTRQAAKAPYESDSYEDEARAEANWEKEYDRTHNTLECSTCGKKKDVSKGIIRCPCTNNSCGGYMIPVGEDNSEIDEFNNDDEGTDWRQEKEPYTKAQLGILPGLMEMLQGAGGSAQGICPNCVKVVRIKSTPEGCPMCGGAMSASDLLDDIDESEAEMKDVQVDIAKEDLTQRKNENDKDDKDDDKDEKDDVEEEDVDDSEFESMEDAIASLYSEDGKEPDDDDEESDDDDEDEGKEISALFTGADEVRNTRAQDYED